MTAPSVLTSIRRKLAAVAIGAVVLGMSCLVAALLCEGLIRIVKPQQLSVVHPDIWMPMDSVGWINRPNVHTTINTGERTATVLTDGEGYRVGSAPRDTVARQVLLIGDSFAQSLQVDYEISFSNLIQASVSRLLGTPVLIRDSGVDGWDPPQYLWRARRALGVRHYDALLVTVYLGNDVVATRSQFRPARQPVRNPGITWPHGFSKAAFVTAVFYPVNDYLKGHSHLFVFLKRSFGVVLMRVGMTAVDFPDEILKKQASSPRWDITADFCRQIAEEAAKHGTPTLFAIIPTSYQADPAEFRGFLKGFKLDSAAVDLDQPNRLLDERLKAYHLNIVDPLPDLRARVRAGADLYGHTDRHFSPAGHVAFTAAVDTALARVLRTPAAATRH